MVKVISGVIVGVVLLYVVVFVMEVVFGLIGILSSNKDLAKKHTKASKFLATKREVVNSLLESVFAFVIKFVSAHFNKSTKKE